MPREGPTANTWARRHGPDPNYTTGEVARLAGVSQTTVHRCCDAGDLTHFRLPLTRHRRVRRADLIQWADRHGLTLDWSALTEGTA